MDTFLWVLFCIAIFIVVLLIVMWIGSKIDSDNDPDHW